MITIAPENPAGSWLLAEALLRCDSARERIEATAAALRAVDAECVWRARAIDRLREGLGRQEQELTGLLARVGDVAASLVGE